MRIPPSVQELWDMQPDKERYSVYKRIGKAMSLYPAKLFLHTPITANQVSLLHGALYIGGASLLIARDPTVVLAGALLIRVAGIFDQAAGQVAYARNTASPEGYLFDNVISFLEGISLFLFVFVAVYLRYPHWVTVLVGMIAMLSDAAKELLGFIPDSVLWQMLLRRQPWAALDSSHGKPQTDRFLASVVSVFSPGRRLPRILGAAMHHFNIVNLLLAAAAIDLVLFWVAPSIAARLSGLYAFLIVCAILGSVNSVGRVVYIVHTWELRRTYREHPQLKEGLIEGQERQG